MLVHGHADDEGSAGLGNVRVPGNMRGVEAECARRGRIQERMAVDGTVGGHSTGGHEMVRDVRARWRQEVNGVRAVESGSDEKVYA